MSEFNMEELQVKLRKSESLLREGLGDRKSGQSKCRFG